MSSCPDEVLVREIPSRLVVEAMNYFRNEVYAASLAKRVPDLSEVSRRLIFAADGMRLPGSKRGTPTFAREQELAISYRNDLIDGYRTVDVWVRMWAWYRIYNAEGMAELKRDGDMSMFVMGSVAGFMAEGDSRFTKHGFY